MSTEMGFEAADRIDKLCDEFEQAFKTGTEPEIEAFLTRIEKQYRPVLLRLALHARFWQERLLCPGGGLYVWNKLGKR